MKDKKKMLICILLLLVCIMTIAYAFLAQELQITGTTSIGSTWQVEITDITEKEKSIGASSKEEPTYTATTATFNAGFVTPGDYIIYEVEISNLGTLDAIVNSINVSNADNAYIKYTITGIKENNKLVAKAKKTIEIKIEYRKEVTRQPQNINSNITLTLNFIESFGTEATTDDTKTITVTKPEYKVGDKIRFAGSDWYVIEDSAVEKDYVTVLKDVRLTASELTDNYSYKDATGTAYNTMAYYWSDTCHYSGIEGTNVYTSIDISNCHGYTNYVGSKAKEYIENVYIPTIDKDGTRLKSVAVNGISYKARLITTDELINLGCKRNNNLNYSCASSTNASWLYSSTTGRYYTMIPNTARDDNFPWYVGDQYETQYFFNNGIRPVINLYKSAIE